jgi:hypothetical protein
MLNGEINYRLSYDSDTGAGAPNKASPGGSWQKSLIFD